MTPCPVLHGDKRPVYGEWQNTTADEAARQFEEHPDANIGIVLGAPSDGLVDIDLDSELASEIAKFVLPPTAFSFGRPSKPRSHLIYRCDDAVKTKQFKHPDDGSMLVEQRANGAQTVFPGSTHASGEAIEFCGEPGEPARIRWDKLLKACAVVSVGTVICPHWGSGSRHRMALAAAGLLASRGIDESVCCSLVRALAMLAQDPEEDDRLACVATTYQRHRRGERIEYRPEFTERLGIKALETCIRWLGGTYSDPVQERTPIAQDLSTDLGTAEAFAATNRKRLLFADQVSGWYAANADVYAPVSSEVVMERIIGFAKDAASSLDHNTFSRTASSLFSERRLRSILALSKPLLRSESTQFDDDPLLAGCTNGVLDLRTGTLIKPSSVVTKRLGTTFDVRSQCPTFSEFLAKIFGGDEDVIAFIQRAVGYTLTGSTAEQCLFLLIGSGANGKSTFLKILQRLLGDYAGSVPMHTLMHNRFGNERTDDLAALKGRRMVAAQEGEADQKLAEAKVKLMTGGDPISCRRLYGAYETYDPQFKLWDGHERSAANHRHRRCDLEKDQRHTLSHHHTDRGARSEPLR